jgi:hypothetical protein
MPRPGSPQPSEEGRAATAEQRDDEGDGQADAEDDRESERELRGQEQPDARQREPRRGALDVLLDRQQHGRDDRQRSRRPEPAPKPVPGVRPEATRRPRRAGGEVESDELDQRRERQPATEDAGGQHRQRPGQVMPVVGERLAVGGAVPDQVDDRVRQDERD